MLHVKGLPVCYTDDITGHRLTQPNIVRYFRFFVVLLYSLLRNDLSFRAYLLKTLN